MDEVLLAEAGVVPEQELGVVRDNGAVEVVIRVALVDVVAHAGVEDEVDALVEEVLDVSVGELRGVAHRIGGYRMLSEVVHLARALAAEHDLEAELGEERVPEGHLLVEAESERQSDLCYRADGLTRLFEREDTAVFVLDEVGNIVLFRLSAALFTAVARDEVPALAEADDVELTVRGTASALHGARSIGERREFVLGDEGGFARRSLLGVERAAESSHKSRNSGTYNVASELLLERAEHCVIEEGAALHDDVLAELVRRICSYYLINGVLDYGRGQSCGDVLDGRAVLLRLLYGAVHEDGAARAEVDGVLGEETELREFGDIVAERHCKGLYERAAARRARLVEHDAVNCAVSDFEALDVLTADIEDEIDLGHEIFRRRVVGDGFNNSLVRMKGVLN